VKVPINVLSASLRETHRSRARRWPAVMTGADPMPPRILLRAGREAPHERL
jgi:hypothetical protein